MERIVRGFERRVEKIFLEKGIGSILVAVSGGADSVALLTACSRVSKRIGLRIEAVNCNFHLRGNESNRDSEFTTNLCKGLGVKLHSLEYDVKAYIKEHPDISIEMACRELRYADFFRIMEKEGFDRIAVAHNADDDIETLFLNLLRGSGSRGLKGMEEDNGKVIRPLLEISRKEIEKYLKILGIPFIIDSSNLSSEYRRNFIRRDILTLIESKWPGARKSVSKTVAIMKEESKIIEDFYKRQLRELCPETDVLMVYSEGVTIGTILRFIEPFRGNSKTAEEIMEALSKDFRERTWKLSERYEAILERDRLRINDINHGITEPQFSCTEMIITSATLSEIKANPSHNIVYLPSDLTNYIIRKPQKGDRMLPLGMRGSRLVSDIIRDARLDRMSKSQLRVIVRKSDNEIIWLSGLKRSRHELIASDSIRCYKIELIIQ